MREANLTVLLPIPPRGPIREVPSALAPGAIIMSALDLYEGLVASKKIERDHAQEKLVAQLVVVEDRVVAHRSARRVQPVGWLFGSASQAEPVKGLYIFGDV